jgi:hypothetical protein
MRDVFPHFFMYGEIMNVLLVIAGVVILFFAAAMYYALRFPNGKIFPSRRDKLLRKVGPLAVGKLEDVTIRFLTRAGGEVRVMLAAIYRYETKDSSFTITLPTESTKLGGGLIKTALTSQELEREMPERLELSDGTLLEGRETVRQYYLDLLRQKRPEVSVLYDRKRPMISTVRDWR